MKIIVLLLLTACGEPLPTTPYTVESLNCQNVQKTECGLTLFNCDGGASVVCYKPAKEEIEGD